LFSLTNFCLAKDVTGRLGIGMSNELINGVPALSMKMQKSPLYAFGLIGGFNFADNDGGYGAGAKFYRVLLDEPQLNFYMSGMGALINKKAGGASTSGFQLDGTLGTEFHFVGMESIGFSFEFGLSANKLQNNFKFQTVGNHIVTAAVHFYL
jgi:hypothetical protein